MPDRAPQPVDRQLPTDEARDLISLVRDIAQREIAPQAAEEEDAGHFPRDVFRLLSESGLLGLPYDSEFGGGDQPYEVYLQVLEELAAARLTVGLGVSVHSLACHALANYGTKEQQVEHLPGDARRRPARRVLPLRAVLGLGRRVPADQGRAGR